jgi:hypothetical protein
LGKAESHIRIEGDFCFGCAGHWKGCGKCGLIGQGTFRQMDRKLKEFGFYNMLWGYFWPQDQAGAIASSEFCKTQGEQC